MEMWKNVLLDLCFLFTFLHFIVKIFEPFQYVRPFEAFWDRRSLSFLLFVSRPLDSIDLTELLSDIIQPRFRSWAPPSNFL